MTESKQALLVVLFGGLVFGAALALLPVGDGPEPFRTVASVRHSGAP